jgi:hypothetical protein
MTENNIPSTTETNNEKWFKIVSAAFALLILVGYSFFLYFLVGKASAKLDDVIWTRLIYLFSGVEAIVFSAVGFIFGREVNRGRAEKAEKEKKESKKEEQEARDKAKEEQMKGENLAKLILNKVEKSNKDSLDLFKVRSMSKDNTENELLDLVMFTKKIYPEIE